MFGGELMVCEKSTLQSWSPGVRQVGFDWWLFTILTRW